MKLLTSLSLLLLFLGGISVAKAEVVKKPHIEVELVTERNGVPLTGNTTVALRLKMEAGWHTYWRNPGDSGEAIRVTGTLPPGVVHSDVRWPVPQRISTPPLVNYGYEGEVFLLSDLSIAHGAPSMDKIPMQVRASWLVCREECIPGNAQFEIVLPVVQQAAPLTPWHEAIERTRTQLAVDSKAWSADAEVQDESILLRVHGPAANLDISQAPSAPPAGAGFFPYSENILRNAEPQQFTPQPGGFLLKVAKSPRFVAGDTIDGVLALQGQPGGIAISARLPSSLLAKASVWRALLFAFLGGMILNLMPCVFPVLFIKILNFVELAGAHRRKALSYSLSYAAGIQASFLLLAGGLIFLRAGGQHLGWGFQLQSPVFLAILVFLLLGMSLNLLGVFEIGSSWMGVGQKLSERSGYAGSFFSGILATVVATPCTAPFMGTAMGYALVHSAPVSLSVFSSLGLGLAFPYVLLSAFPQLTKRLPRPGMWMVTFKQLMAFPLLATVIWLLSVLGLQTDLLQVIRVLGALLLFSMALWVYGQQGRRPGVSLLLSLIIVATSIFVGFKGLTISTASKVVASASEPGSDTWGDFSEANLGKALATGRPVFVNFTAAWCITCQVNEKVVFEASAVKDKFLEKKVVLMKADWTNQNDEISKRLETYGRDGVPLYVLYRAGQKADPQILPQLLTPEGFVQELNKL